MQKEASVSDRRIFERIDVSFPVEIEHEEGKSIQGECFNIGGSGMGVVLRRKLPKSDNIRVTMRIPDLHDPQSIFGKVAWTKDMPNGQSISGLGFDVIDLFKLWRIFRLPGVRKPIY